MNMVDSTEVVEEPSAEPVEADEIVTTAEEIEGYHIVRAIAAAAVSPDRIVMRDAKS
ncbi:MAG: hypothetical protein HKN78_02395, partial [Sphingomonadaceae bacterium]|nr:hypothetical protein [Sphingomonadaceae bacterium]